MSVKNMPNKDRMQKSASRAINISEDMAKKKNYKNWQERYTETKVFLYQSKIAIMILSAVIWTISLTKRMETLTKEQVLIVEK